MEMKSKLLFLGLLPALLILASAPTAKAAVNMIANPGFEIDDDGDNEPDYWTLWGSGDTQELRDDPALVYEGSKALYQTGGFALAWPSGFHPVTPGEVYTFAAYVMDLLPEGSPSPVEPQFKIEHALDGEKDPDTFYTVPLPIPHDGEYHLVYLEIECLEGYNGIRTVLVTGDSSEYMWDNAWFGAGRLRIGGATDPVPEDGSSVANDLAELSWTNPKQTTPEEIITCNVWFSDDFPEYGKYEDDPNFTDFATQIADNQPGEIASLASVALEMDHVYYWRVDVHDPNKAESPNYFVIGEVWTFDTFNQAPDVEAGLKGKGWLTEATVDVQLDGSATDDGMPLDPGTVTFQWTVDDGPGTVAFDNDQVEDPIVTFDTAGQYTLRLTADDSLLSASDTVIVDIFPGDYTGLVAHWSLDEESGPTAVDSVGGHDGTLMGDPTWMPAGGQVGGAIELDGDDDGNGDYIEIADSTGGWADLTEEVTVSCWIKVNQFTWDWQALVCKGNTSYRMQRNWGADSIWFGISEAGVGGTLSVNDGKWHHVAGTYDGEIISLYIDGYLDVFEENTDGIGVDEMLLTIGQNLGYMASFDGLIDEVRIYEVALPAEKVLAEFVSDGGSKSCGQAYNSADFNRDCRVDLLDFAEMAAIWLTCDDITEPSCLE
jgi:hypothetical protein